MNKNFRRFLTLSFKNYAIWLSFACARAKTARKSRDLLHRSCWVTLEIYTWHTSPRMEVPLDLTYIIVYKNTVLLWISADGSILVQTFLNWSRQKSLNFTSYLYYVCIPECQNAFCICLNPRLNKHYWKNKETIFGQKFLNSTIVCRTLTDCFSVS